MDEAPHSLNPPGGPARDQHDGARLRHARERFVGFPVGQYLQPPPMLFTRDGHNVFLGDMYRGRSAFLICAGPSLTTHDLSQLDQRGVLTLAVNNAAAVYRPHLWCSVDDPSHFVDAIWKDPGITKFVPLCHMEKLVFVRNEACQLVPSEDRVGDMPAVFGFRRNEAFVADQWLFEDTFNWGNHSERVDQYGNQGSRSVMYIALRLLFYLGVRRVFLLGCDFQMQPNRANYAFEQDRSAASVRSNNQTYRILNQRLEKLRPHFEKHDFHVFNCTPNSGLKVFSHVSYEEAIETAVATLPRRMLTAGLYDSAAKQAPSTPTVSSLQTSPQSNSPADSGAIPRTTLVVPLTGHELATFGKTWQKWTMFHPWLSTLPVVLVSDDYSLLNQTFEGRLPNGARRIVFEPHPGAAQTRLGEVTSTMLDVLSEIKTEWWLKLDADAIAVQHSPAWPDPRWFATSPAGTSPVLIAHRWGFVRSERYLNDLEHWSSQIADLAGGPSWDRPKFPSDGPLKVPTISSWCIFGKTDWACRLAHWHQAEAPDVPYATFLHYCALRMGLSVMRVDMKALGWSHSFARKGPSLRQRRVLAATNGHDRLDGFHATP